MSDTAQAVQVAFEKLEQLVHQYGPATVDLAAQVVRINAIQNFVLGGAAALVIVGSVLVIRWAVRSAETAGGDMIDNVYQSMAAVVAGTIGLFAVLVVFVTFLNVWSWIALFNPKLAVAHAVLTGLVGG